MNKKIEWKTFGSQLPQLGMSIDVLAEGTSLPNLGQLKRIEDLGGGWIGFDTDFCIGVSVKNNYQWRETF